MNAFTRTIAAGGLALSAMLGAPGGASAQVNTDDSDEAPEITYRKSVMQGLVVQLGSLRALLTAEVPYTGDIRKHTAAVLDNTSMLEHVFPPRSTGVTSAAADDIWTRREEFEQRVQALRQAAQAMDAAAQAGERPLALAYFQVLVTSCGSCHASFRLPPAFPAGAEPVID